MELPQNLITRSKTAFLALALTCGGSNVALSQEDGAWWKSLFRPKLEQCDSVQVALPATSQTESPTATPDESGIPTAIDATGEKIEMLEREKSAPIAPRKQGDYTLIWDDRMAQMDSVWKETPHPLMGYRVQLFSGSLQRARELRSLARKRTPLPIYLSSMPPNYRITLGNFRTKWEAENEKQTWLNVFPLSIVIPMEIQLPELTISSENQDPTIPQAD